MTRQLCCRDMCKNSLRPNNQKLNRSKMKFPLNLNPEWKVVPRSRPIHMMTSSNGNIFHVTGPLCGEFTGPGEFPAQRPVTRSFDVFFYLCLNKRLSQQPWGWWFETPSWSLWRQCNYELTTRHRSHFSSSSRAADRTLSSRSSPNHTTWGRRRPPHSGTWHLGRNE